MIDITLKSIRKPHLKWPYQVHNQGQTPIHTPAHNPNAVELGTPPSKTKSIYEESIRRDKIIKDLAAACTFKPGDRVSFVRASEHEKYGHEVYVTNIVDSYTKYGKHDKWPSNDYPMIVHCEAKDTKEVFFCTVNMMKAYEEKK